MLKCRSCGAPGPVGAGAQAWTCEYCHSVNAAQSAEPGAPASPPPAPAAAARNPQMRNCTGCGALIHISATACPKCGAPAQPVAAAPAAGPAPAAAQGGAVKSRVTAAVLAFLLGGLGVHKFYCGKTGLGLLYLVFFWTYIPAFIGLVEGILYLTQSNDDAEFTRKFCA